VVIAIIAILSSLLLPSLSKARGVAKQSYCMNNLKQLSVGLISYVNDNNDYIPPQFNGGTTSAFYYNTVMEKNGYWNQKTLYCPEMQTNSFAWPWYPHFGVNISLWNNISESYGSNKMSQQRQPSKKLFLADSWQNRSDDTPDMTKGFWRIMFSGTTHSNTSYGRPASRHSKSVNTLWLDGHTENSKASNVINPFLQKPFDYSWPNINYLTWITY